MPERSSTSSLISRETERPSSVLTTFYSFKGGVGRTQSLYNVAARLTAYRRQVLMVDVDLEAPGLSITLDEERRRSKEGFAEIAGALLDDLETAFANQKGLDYLEALKARYAARLQRALHELDPPMSPKNEDLEKRLQRELDVQLPDEGSLSLLSVGRVGTDYTQQVAQLPLSEAYDDLLDATNQAVVKSLVEDFQTPVNRDRLHTRGHVFATLFRELLRTATVPDRNDETFDHVLIDSRSGLADVGGLCLLGLAETRVVLTGLNEQNVTGTKMVLDDIAEVDDDARDENHLITVFSPIPQGEADLLADRLEAAKDTLNVSDEQVRRLHYHPRIALVEKPFTEPLHEHTRIYDDYEDLTDHLLALTDSDARSLVSDALERFREDDDSEDGAGTDESENRYANLASELIPAAFLDEDYVESTLDGLCTQTIRSKPYDLDATCLFDLWIALSPDDFRVLGISADFYNALQMDAPNERVDFLLRRNMELDKRISEKRPQESQAWYNWGAHLSQLVQLVQAQNPDSAVSLYQEAFEKYQKAVDLQPDKYAAWYNWGNDLVRLAQLVQDDDPDRTEALYREAFEKFQEATDIKPDKHEAWYNWGTDLAHLAQLVQDDDPDRAEALYREAFEKYQETVDINPDDFQTYYNWGIDLVRLGRLLRSQNQPQKAQQAFSEAAEKSRSALSNETHLRALFWLIVALAERDTDDDIEEATDLLDTALKENPEFVYWFETEDAEVVRTHPELREILDEHREKIDKDEREEDPESPDDLDASDLPD